VSVEPVDAVVIGANIRGLVSATVLGALGYRTVLIERGSRVGGADGSFPVAGHRFDFGLHVLDEDRSPVATRLFRKVLGANVQRTRLRRAIVLRNQRMPYAPLPAEMPPELRALLSDERTDDGWMVDEIGGAEPTRARLAAHYGRAFADLIFEEVLPSYPTEARHLAFGVAESKLLTNLYPWFFPRARRRGDPRDESRRFHDRLRAGVDQYVLHPRSGGFGAFAEALAANLDPSVELITGASDLEVDVAPGTHTVRSVRAGGRTFEAPHHFWAGPWPALCALLGLPCQDVATDRVLLGSFVLSEPARTEHQEILVGDPTHPINRISFPGMFRSADAAEPLMQVEFAVPVASEPTTDPAHWRARWEESARRLGLWTDAHEVEHFDFKAVRLHFNGYGAEGEPLRDADPALLATGSNLHPVVPSMANLNLNNYVPRTVAQVAQVVAARR
jgi:hypothetical protein